MKSEPLTNNKYRVIDDLRMRLERLDEALKRPSAREIFNETFSHKPVSEHEWMKYFEYLDNLGHNCGMRKSFHDWLTEFRLGRLNEAFDGPQSSQV